jgi:hypothetical protein
VTALLSTNFCYILHQCKAGISVVSHSSNVALGAVGHITELLPEFRIRLSAVYDGANADLALLPTVLQHCLRHCWCKYVVV